MQAGCEADRLDQQAQLYSRVKISESGFGAFGKTATSLSVFQQSPHVIPFHQPSRSKSRVSALQQMKTKNPSSSPMVFIHQEFDTGWVIEKFTRLLAVELNQLSIATVVGTRDKYQGEPIVFQSKFLYAHSFSETVVNSVFVTHLDDRAKEIEIKELRDSCNSYVCMSPEDAVYLLSLGFRKEEVVGIDLPFFDQTHEPLKLAIFSKRYADGRKNEEWLCQWLEANPAARDRFIFSFLGSGWLPVAERLERAGWSVEVLSIGATLSREYDIQIRALRSVDYHLYMGFDGGALGTYDAFREEIPVIASRVSYHHGLTEKATLFGSKQEFFEALDAISKAWGERDQVIRSRSMREYAKRIAMHWRDRAAAIHPDHELVASLAAITSDGRSSSLTAPEAKSIYRENQQPLSVFRIVGSLKRLLVRKTKK